MHCLPVLSIYKNMIKNHTESVDEKIKSFKFNLCEYSASRHSILQTHIESVHEKMKSYHCNGWHHSEATAQSLRIHIESVHEKIKQFKCQQCSFQPQLRRVLSYTLGQFAINLYHLSALNASSQLLIGAI